MNQHHDATTTKTADRRFPATDMSIGLMLVLVAAGLPRTVLADLDRRAGRCSWRHGPD